MSQYKNYPLLGSGIKYYAKLAKYINSSGFVNKIDYLTINEFEEIIGEPIKHIGMATFCDRENIPLNYTKAGKLYKKQKLSCRL